MPFTPFHMGPGIIVKALLRGSFSLMVFGWAQIVMDIQPLIVLITDEGRLHGFSHTFAGATLLAVFAALTGKSLSEFGWVVLGLSRKGSPIEIAWWVTTLSAFVGTYSHVVLDGIMHSDVRPFYPLSDSNGLLGILPVSALHQLCIYSGVVGTVIYYGTQLKIKEHEESI